jgi:DNA-binding PadR family transcriptional regulator
MPARSSDLPSYRERQALQILLSGNWQPAKALYASSRTTLSKMVAKGWIEQRGSLQTEYRITEHGREAFHTPMPIRAAPKPIGDKSAP